MNEDPTGLGPILELSRTPMAVVDDQGVIRVCNATMEDMAGGSVIGRTQTAVCLEIEGRMTTGDPLDIQSADVPGRPGWRVCTLRRSKPPTPVLQKRSDILVALVESAPVAILILDLDKCVTMWNPACERLFGWTRDEVIGKPYPLVPADEWEQFERFYDTVIGGEGFTGVEAQRAGKDGTPIYVAISTAPIRDQSGLVTGAMAILEDITERRQLQERYRQAQKMEAIGRLAGGIAHDFNNVLTVILAYCDALLVTRDSRRMLKDVAAIQRSAERAADLTRQLLAFGRRQVMKAKLIDLNQVIRNSVEMLGRLIGEDIAIDLELTEGLGPVRVDPTQLEQLLMNLSANARDAMPHGGRIRIGTRASTHEDYAALGDGAWVRLSVRDSGQGMDEATVARVFEPFFTTKELGQGTGLGLASVYGIVRQSGGEVEVHSEPGRGTEFRIYLPEAGGLAQDPDSGAEEEQMLGRGTTVLVAEDDDDVRSVVRRVLEARGFTVVVASGGAEALEAARALDGPLDLLLTDVVMEGMNGRQLAAALVQERPGTRVLFMSGYTDDEILRRGVERGTAFVHKPFTSVALLQAIRDVLDT